MKYYEKLCNIKENNGKFYYQIELFGGIDS